LYICYNATRVFSQSLPAFQPGGATMPRRFTATRHANAPKLPEPQTDSDRRISALGLRQAALRRQMPVREKPYDLVIAPPLERVIQTAIEVTSVSRDQIVLVPELFTPDGPDGELLNKMFYDKRLGYATLRTYFEQTFYPDGPDCLKRFGQTAWDRVYQEAKSRGAEDVGIFGSALYLPVMGFMAHPAPDALLLDFDMQECDAFVMDVGDDSRVQIIRQLPGLPKIDIAK
jgi:broad specificity phosphatase PhoE